jgi:hypothetical protein
MCFILTQPSIIYQWVTCHEGSDQHLSPILPAIGPSLTIAIASAVTSISGSLPSSIMKLIGSYIASILILANNRHNEGAKQAAKDYIKNLIRYSTHPT